MHKSFIALVGAAGLGIAAMVPAPANAECAGCALGAGILGGVAAGAIIEPSLIVRRLATIRRRQPLITGHGHRLMPMEEEGAGNCDKHAFTRKN
jgi:hypothetical protein